MSIFEIKVWISVQWVLVRDEWFGCYKNRNWILLPTTVIAFRATFWRFRGNVHDSSMTFFDRSWNLLKKIAKSHFVPPIGGLRDNVHGSSKARWKVRDRLPVSANWTFLPGLTVEALWADIGQNRCVQKGVGHFECKFQGEWASPTNDYWHQNTSLWAITWHCLHDVTFSHLGTVPACVRHDRHTMTVNTRASIALHG